jgi:AcrR family transcriptional regulator
MAKTDPKAKLAEAALKLLAKMRWPDLTLAAVARSAKVPLRDLQTLCPTKPMLIGFILDRIGEEVGRRYKPDDGSSHDRLLDVAVTWFETQAPKRKAIHSLYEGLKFDPLALIDARSDIVSAASWLLVLAEVDTGSALPIRALALAGAMARAIPVWLEDDKDLTKTMATLDADISRGESFFRRSKS